MLISGCIKPEIFRIFLDWGYSKRLKITKENALDLVLASEYLLAPTLVASYAKFLVSNALAVESAWLIFNLFQRIKVHFDNKIEYEQVIAMIKKYIKVCLIIPFFQIKFVQLKLNNILSRNILANFTKRRNFYVLSLPMFWNFSIAIFLALIRKRLSAKPQLDGWMPSPYSAKNMLSSE